MGLFRDHGFFKDLAALVLKVAVNFAVIFKSREEEMRSVCVGTSLQRAKSLWECPL